MVRLLFLTLVLALMAQPSGAAEPPDLVVTDWRVVTTDNSEITSDCIGQMTSPKCVADTMLACSTQWPLNLEDRWDKSTDVFYDNYPPVCDPVRPRPGEKGSTPRTFFPYLENGLPKRIRYKLASFELTEKFLDYPFFLMDKKTRTSPEAQLGDTVVVLYHRTCRVANNCVAKSGFKKGFSLKPNCPLTKCYDNHPNQEGTQRHTPGSPWVAILRQKQTGAWVVASTYHGYRDVLWKSVEKLFSEINWGPPQRQP